MTSLDIRNNVCRVACATLALLLLPLPNSRAQDSPPVEEYLGNFFDPDRNMYFWLRHFEGRQLGDTEPFTSAGTIRYLPRGNGMLLLEGQILSTNDGGLGASAGIHRRWWIGEELVVGIGTALDCNQSPWENTFQQGAFSVELLGEVWGLRLNGYTPLGPRIRNVAVVPGGGAGQFVFQDQFLVFQGGGGGRIDEVAMKGLDVELSRQLGTWGSEVFGGYYHRVDRLGGNAHGITGGVRGYLTDSLTASLAISEDSVFGTNVFGGFTWFFGGSGGRSYRDLSDRLTLPVERNRQVAIRQEVQVLPASTVLTQGGAPITIAHVAGGAAPGPAADGDSIAAAPGSGTFEDPFVSLAAAAGSGSGVILVRAGSVFVGESITLAPDQMLLGEGDGVVHMIVTDQLGAVALPSAGSGLSRPRLVDAPGNAIILSSGSVVSNFQIDSPQLAALYADAGVGGLVQIERVTTSGGMYGFHAAGSSADFVFQDVLFNDASDAILRIAGGSASVAFRGSIQQSTAGGVLDVSGGHTGQVRFDPGSTIDASNGTGLRMDNADGQYEFYGNADLRGGAAGVDIHGGSDGTFEFGPGTSIRNIGGTAFQVSGGAPTVTYLGDLAGRSGASLVAIAGTTGGSVLFGGGTITHAAGNGILLDGVHGDVTFAQNLLIENSGSHGVSIIGGGTGNFTFADLAITNAALRGLDLAGSAGTIQINNLWISGTGSEGLFASSATSGLLSIGRDLGDAFQISGTGATAAYFNGSRMNVTVAATGLITGSGVNALIFDNGASGDYLMPNVSVSVTDPADLAFSDALAVSKLNGTSPNRIELNYTLPVTGLTLYFSSVSPGFPVLEGEAAGPTLSVILVSPGATFALGSYASADPSDAFQLQGFQLNFAPSDVQGGELNLGSWATEASLWPLSLGSLDTSTGQTLVAGATLGSSVLVGTSTLLGTFNVVAPSTPGDYLITVQSTGGPLDTALLQTDGSIAPITDYGDILIRVEAPVP